jgi:hypothetical protein
MARVETVREIREILVALARRFAFREIAFLVGGGATGLALSQREVARVQQLCAYGQRLFDLDAEDYDNPDAALGANTDTRIADLVEGEFVPRHLVERGRRCRFRQDPHERPRGALLSLYPAYELFLELIAARWERREMMGVIVGAFLAAEYAPLLAWQQVLGHAGDPLEISKDPAFAGPQSRWGRYDATQCSHTRPQRSAASRALRVTDEPASGWRSYLDRQHSTVSHALGICAGDCKAPCTVMNALDATDRDQVTEACGVALAYRSSALIRLRHTAPTGHGFGVPSPAEVAEAWRRTREGIARRGGVGVAAMQDDGFVLPGLPSLFSAIAGQPLRPDTLLHDTASELVRQLDPDELTTAPA